MAGGGTLGDCSCQALVTSGNFVIEETLDHYTVCRNDYGHRKDGLRRFCGDWILLVVGADPSVFIWKPLPLR